MGDCAPLGEGKLGPHLTQSRLGCGLPPYQLASCCIQPFGDSKNGPKIGEGLRLLFGEEELGPIEHKVPWAEAYRHTKWHLDILMHPAV